VVGVAATFTGVWVEVAGLIAELDVLAGFADLATADPTRPYCKPEILDRDEGELVIKVRGWRICLPAWLKLVVPGHPTAQPVPLQPHLMP
jgi:hypothetical protein